MAPVFCMASAWYKIRLRVSGNLRVRVTAG
jgi:hypothetical protein